MMKKKMGRRLKSMISEIYVFRHEKKTGFDNPIKRS